MLAMIRRNIPISYNIENFTTEFIEKMLSSRHNYIICGGKDHTIKIIDIESGKLFASLEGHTDWIFCIALSSDGALYLVAVIRPS
jgi:WD40 repeat protein